MEEHGSKIRTGFVVKYISILKKKKSKEKQQQHVRIWKEEGKVNQDIKKKEKSSVGKEQGKK